MTAVVSSAAAPEFAHNPLENVLKAVPDAVLDVRYASPDNVLHRAAYPRAAAYLRRSTAEKLARAADHLRRGGQARLVVFDAYRPLSVQRLLWEANPDPRFVADPARGSLHNRGGAVDAGLADCDGRALKMPTGFDDFGPRAAHGAPDVPPELAARARLLKEAMEASGFESLPAEWWHYADPAARSWPLLDVPLEDLP